VALMDLRELYMRPVNLIWFLKGLSLKGCAGIARSSLRTLRAEGGWKVDICPFYSYERRTLPLCWQLETWGTYVYGTWR